MGATAENRVPGLGARRRSICLCMIVRDEAKALVAALRSCRELIDYWVICDTGSTDGTQSVIRDELHGIPGELHEDAWVDFGHNRNRLIERAQGRSEYLLLLDADETVEADPGVFEGLTLDAYCVPVVGEAVDRVKRVVRGAIPWRYVGSVCEYVESPLERGSGALEGLVIRSQPPGPRQRDRLPADRELLEAAVRANPTDARAAFYLARTLQAIAQLREDDGLLQEALRAYAHRASLAGDAEEAYCSLLHAGTVCEQLEDWPSACEFYLRAWESRPSRFESVFAAAAGLLARQLPRAAVRFTSLAETRLAVPDDTLHVSPWIYEWGLLMLHSVAALESGDPDVSLRASRHLLSVEALPDDRREAVQQNISLAMRRKASLAVGAAADRPAGS